MKFLPVIFSWWLYILALTLIFLPISNKYLKFYPGKGYAFAKAMGITFTSLGSFLLAYLHITPFGKVGFFFIPVLIILLDGFLVFKGIRQKSEKTERTSYRFFLEAFFLEILFLLGFIACAYMRSQQPEIFGLEKFMDYGFVNSILRSTYMPAADIWLAGNTINYYYFGQYICAVLAAFTNTAAGISYNLMLAVIFGEALILSYSLGAGIYTIMTRKVEAYSYKKLILAGLISMTLLSLGGNLHSFFYGYLDPFASSMNWKPTAETAYFYPDSTRFIGYDPETDDKTITEFPSYSFVVADLHGHVSDIPQALLLMGFALAFGRRAFHGIRSEHYSIGLPLLIGSLLGAMFMTNAWDFPIYLTLLSLLMIFSSFRYSFSGSTKKEIRSNYVNVGLTLASITIVAIAVILPFSMHFQNFSMGIGFVRSHSPLWQLFMLWGHFWLLTLPFFLFTMWNIFTYLFKKSDTERKTKLFQNFSSGRMLLLLLICCGYGLLLIPEVIYVRDIYEAGYHRANTMFKVTYQAYLVLSICAGPAFISAYDFLSSLFEKKGRKNLFPISLMMILALFAIVAPLLFLFKAIPGYYGNLKPSHVVGLDGTAFLAVRYVEDKPLIDWLNENVEGQPVILEAPGLSYSKSGRISAMTGLPTVIGWNVHEWLWRNDSELPRIKEKEVDLIYNGFDPSARKELIEKYHIEYIVISTLEKEKYPDVLNSGILELGKVVFRSNENLILQVQP